MRQAINETTGPISDPKPSTIQRYQRECAGGTLEARRDAGFSRSNKFRLSLDNDQGKQTLF